MNSQFTRANKYFNYIMWYEHRTPNEVLGFKPVFAHTGYVSLHKSLVLWDSEKFSLFL